MTVRPLPRSAGRPLSRPRLPFLRISALILIALLVAAWVMVLGEEARRAAERAVAISAWDQTLLFLRDLIGIGARGTPAYLRIDRWQAGLGLGVETLAMSVLAAAFAAAVALPTVLLAARNVAFGNLRPSSSPVWPVLFLIVRGFYIFSRSLPELLWAMLIIFVFNPGVVPGALALGLHNIGILGKLGAEVIEDLDVRPVRALQRAGAGPAQVLAYGILPAVLPQFLTYLLYRWEVIIRTTIVVGFVGAGGLGREFRLNMSYFHYTEIALILLIYFILVVGVDAIAGGLRRLAR
jgi:ABC-type phosphate/phosphonate transport system permease subunit